ncbi:MAG: VWA domain-containing protein [Verrucomicrobiota bacterium]|nr:VWA domain-containing protein [Verrucomicrobiota bacterium]
MAVLLSVVVHMACMWLFQDFALGGAASGAAKKVRDWFDGDRVPPMRVDMMHADPMRIAEKVAGERDTPSRGPIEAGDSVEALSQSSPVLTVPPPIPHEALAPGIPALKEVVAEQIDTTPWMPRQEIAEIYNRTVQDDVAALPRREIPLIERVSKAPDIVPSVDLTGRRFGKDPEPPKPFDAAEVFDTEISKGTFKPPAANVLDTDAKVTTGATEARFAVKPGEKSGGVSGATEGERIAQQEQLQKKLDEAQPTAVPAKDEEERAAQEAQAKITALHETIDYVPIDELLAVGLETYRDPAEKGRVYFRIGIQPRADRNVPVIAKDIVFVQDVSASMTEERMVFCRRGLAAALLTLNPGDRFNVVAFREQFETAFPDWAAATADNVKKADGFIDGMHAAGQTDLFGSLHSLMRLPRDPKRPMIAVLVTDGKPTFGMTESAKIIGEFSKLSNGMVSIYMFGTHNKANTYLLDMLTYGNRGASTVLGGSRWDIPTAFQPVYEGIRNPVMGDISVAFDSASKSEVYPKNSTNLYKDRQLELCGVCPEGTEELVFQVRGLAADKGYDSIFRLNLAKQGKAGAAAVKQRWARQKMYHLVSAYSRDAQQQTMAEMLKVNALYGVPIPYASELK